MAEAFLDTLLEVKQENLANNCKECCICLEDIEVKPLNTGISERPVRLPCKHIVHTICIAKWLSSNQGHNTCPMCRHTLFTIGKPPTTVEAETAAARRELQAFYGTNQLLQRGVRGEPDLYDEGQTFTERLDPEDWDITDGKEFFRRRLMLPNPADPPRNTKEARRRRARNLVEVSTYRHLRVHHPHMPPTISGKELSPSNIEALYTTLSLMGIFDQLWGTRPPPTNTNGPSRRQMFALMRHSGFAYQWREGHAFNCWRRCGWRQPGRLRDASALSANSRALLEREPLPDQAMIRAARREEQRRGGVAGNEGPLVGRMLQNAQPSPARRLMQWYRRHWWRGFAIN